MMHDDDGHDDDDGGVDVLLLNRSIKFLSTGSIGLLLRYKCNHIIMTIGVMMMMKGLMTMCI